MSYRNSERLQVSIVRAGIVTALLACANLLSVLL